MKSIYVMSEFGGFHEYRSLSEFCEKWNVEYQKARYVAKEGIYKEVDGFVISTSIDDLVSKGEIVFNLTHKEATRCLPTIENRILELHIELTELREAVQTASARIKEIQNELLNITLEVKEEIEI